MMIRRHWIGVFLVFVLVLVWVGCVGVCGVRAGAEEVATEAAAEEAGASGTCGENLTWKIIDNTLMISGVGEMDHYERYTVPSEEDESVSLIKISAPWYEERFSKVVIGEGVTSVGDYAFAHKWDLSCVVLPESLKVIGEHAFERTDVSYIYLPDSISRIGCSAFESCDNLVLNRLPASLEAIEPFTFRRCDSLVELVIPDSVGSIGEYAFMSCSCLEKVAIPASVTSIDATAFVENSSLRFSVTVKGSGYEKYNHPIEALKEIRVVKGSYAEQFCRENNLPYTSVDQLPEMQGGSGPSLAELEWSVDNGTLTISGTGWMEDFRHNPIVKGEDGISYMTGINSPWDDMAFSRVVVEEGITSLGKLAFYLKHDVKEYSLPESLAYIGDYVFEDNDGLEEITIPGSVTHIGLYAFWRCSHLTKINLPESIRYIDSFAFYGCIGLEHINLPASVHYIGNDAFKDCGGLKSITVVPGSYAEQYCKEYNLPYGYDENDPVYTPSAVNPDIFWRIEDDTLIISGTGDMDDYMQRYTPREEDDPQCVYGTNAPWDSEVFSRVVIENGITAIGKLTFSNRYGLYSVTLPESLTRIGESAFFCCRNLEEINLDAVTTLDEKSMMGSGIKRITLSPKLERIEWATFRACTELTEIRVPDSVTFIGAEAFSNCFSLEKIYIPASVTEIGPRVFEGCKKLRGVFVEKNSVAEQYCIDNNLPYYIDGQE